jgi:hypothetical protein
MLRVHHAGGSKWNHVPGASLSRRCPISTPVGRVPETAGRRCRRLTARASYTTTQLRALATSCGTPLLVATNALAATSRRWEDRTMTDDTDDQPGAETTIQRAARSAASAAEDLGARLATAGDRLADHAEPVVEHVAPRVRAAARRWRSRRRLRRRGLPGGDVEPLPSLFELHPEARRAPIRELGLREIPVAAILGTAVEGPAQRGRDFLPLRALRTENWRSRWNRVRSATERLIVLPPIDVLRAAGGYWVVDGHNRVAAARRAGQVAIDAAVTAVRLPGEPLDEPEADQLAAMLVEAEDVRAAGAGRLARGATLDRDLTPHSPDPGAAGSASPPEPSASPPASDDEAGRG